MKLRVTIYWLLSFMVLAYCLSHVDNTSKSTAEPTLLTSYIDNKANVVYFSDGLFHAKVLGQLKLTIKPDQLEKKITEYNTLVIEDYQYQLDTELSLNWRVKSQPHQVMLNKNQQSITRIDFKTENMADLSDIHLLFSSAPKIGLPNFSQVEIKFKSIRLDSLNNLNPIMVNFNEWNNFTPIRFSSINGYRIEENLVYKGFIFRLSCWLIISTIIYFLLRINGTHLITTLLICWLIACYSFVTNHLEQHKQITQSFSAEKNHLNQTDLESQKVAQQILDIVSEPSSLISQSDRFILMGSTTFFKLRLKHYLMGLNIGTFSSIKNFIDEAIESDFIVIFVGKQIQYCNNYQKDRWLNTQFKLIHMDEDFCLLRKK